MKRNLEIKFWVAGIAVVFGVLIAACSLKKNNDVIVAKLTCEYLENPLDIETLHPRFSWILESELRGITQKSYQIIVSDDSKSISDKKGNVWESGTIISDETINIVYGGQPLKSDTKYYWRVRVVTNNDEEYWSKPAFFHTALLDSSDWKAGWITSPKEIVHDSPLFRKEFSLEKKIESAYAYVTACGYYELYLNGQKVGDHVLDPPVTDFNKRILYSTFDVSEYLEKGNNAAGVMLGNGAYNYRPAPERYGIGDSRVNNPAFIVQINIEYEDGSEEIVVSDESWSTSLGPITYNNLYGGEDYDATKELPGWNKVNFSDNEWEKAVFATEPKGSLMALSSPPIKVTETIEPVASVKVKDGVYLFDLGQNIAGWWQVTLSGKPGQVVRVRGAETLNDSLFSKPLEQGDRLSEKFRYHSQTWTDYTLKGDQEEIFEPRFFYTGFRYVEVATIDQTDLDEVKVTGRVVSSAMERTGYFESSDSLLNKIYNAGVWSQKGNLVGYPTDCPHREKGAYAGDGQVIAETSMHDFQMASFYRKWINDMRDAQESNGRIPNTCPTLVGGMGGGIAWGSAYVLIPYWMSHYYNDTQILAENYSGMKRYIQYLNNLAKNDANPDEPYIINYFDGYWYSLGEWCAPGQHDCPNHDVVNTFYYYYDVKILSEIARKVGAEEDIEYLNTLCDTIKNAFIEKFFDPETCNYGTAETFQTYQLIALLGDLVPEGYKQKVLKTIIDDIENRDKHLNTGIIGTKYLWPTLVEAGYSDLAYTVATQKTYPGFGYWIENNATSLLEEWGGANSHNHQMFGSVVEYFYKYLAGIQSPLEGNTTAGYHQIYLNPYFPEGLNSVKASLQTMSGQITSSWKKESRKLQYEVEIPANTIGTVVLPVDRYSNCELSESGTLIWDGKIFVSDVEGIKRITVLNKKISIEIESGKYLFVLKEK